MYGENEGGVSGLAYLKNGTNTQTPVEFYQEYLESVSLPALAYPRQSYLAFKDFYLGNSRYPKEMLLWPKRTRIRNDGAEQWYKVREDGAVVCEINASLIPSAYAELVAQVQANLPQNKWYGTDNVDDQFYEFTQKGLISEYVHNFHAQYGGYGKEGLIKTTFPDLNGLVLEIEIWADDGISFFDWFGGGYTLKDEWSESAYVTCRKYWITFDPLFPDKSLSFGITDQIPVGSNSNHKCITWARIVPAPWGENSAEAVDINPIHKIREILTDDTAMNKPESEVNDTNFMKAADRIWYEGLGIRQNLSFLSKVMYQQLATAPRFTAMVRKSH